MNDDRLEIIMLYMMYQRLFDFLKTFFSIFNITFMYSDLIFVYYENCINIYQQARQ